MTNENEIMEQLAQVEDGDFVRILYSKQEDIITMRAGYARGIKTMKIVQLPSTFMLITILLKVN